MANTSEGTASCEEAGCDGSGLRRHGLRRDLDDRQIAQGGRSRRHLVRICRHQFTERCIHRRRAQAGQQRHGRAVHLGNELARPGDGAGRAIRVLQNNPGVRQFFDRQRIHAGVFKSRSLAQRLAQIQMGAEPQTQCAGKGVLRRLRQHGVGHGAAGRYANQDRREISGIVKVGLDKVTQVFEIAVRKHALAAVGLEHFFKFRQIDTDDHRPLLCQLRRQHVRAAVPAFLTG